MDMKEQVYMLAIEKYKGIKDAAQSLHISPPALSIFLSNLEERSGVHFFDRIGKQISLTHQGQIFYNYAISIVKSMEEAKSAVSNVLDVSNLNGQLCLGTIESICASIFPELLAEYHHLYPNVSISIITDSPEVLLNRMNENAIDIVYILDRRIYDTRWHKTLESPERNIFVASPKHPLAQKDHELGLDEVLHFPFLLTEKNASYRYMLEQYLASIDHSIQPFLEIGNTEFIIQMLLKNMGISFLPEFTIQKELEQGQLKELKVRDFHMQTWRQIFYHKDKWVTREMQEFLKLAEKMDTKKQQNTR